MTYILYLLFLQFRQVLLLHLFLPVKCLSFVFEVTILPLVALCNVETFHNISYLAITNGSVNVQNACYLSCLKWCILPAFDKSISL